MDYVSHEATGVTLLGWDQNVPNWTPFPFTLCGFSSNRGSFGSTMRHIE